MSSSPTSPSASRVSLGTRVDAGVRSLARDELLRSRFCSPAGLQRRPWLARLTAAIRERSFVLHFQPIVSLRDGSVAHHEALLRLADEPDGSLVAPARFLPAAERYGLIGEIDRLVVDEAISVLAGDAGHSARIAINLSALSVTDPAMLGHIERQLAYHGVAPSRLVIELTETAPISDMRLAKSFCAAVLALGCEVALDDFGAGFGSFQYLKHLPFTYLKIDGDFVRLLPVSPTDQLVVAALADVVRGMRRETIAEFVGDQATIDILADFGVDYAQGFAVGRPAPLFALSAQG
jgi:EAL domain-containing protein (putative c-di-GMP-specific phosphodiesterase class I)